MFIERIECILDDIFGEGIRGKGLEFIPGKTFHDKIAPMFSHIDGQFFLDGKEIHQREAFERFSIKAAWLTGQLTYYIIDQVSHLITNENKDLQHIENVIIWIITSEERLVALSTRDKNIFGKLDKLRSFFVAAGKDIYSFPTKDSFSSVLKSGGDYVIETTISGEKREEIILSQQEIDTIMYFRVENNTKLGER